MGKFDESIKDLRKATELRPNEGSTHNNLGLSFFEKGMFSEALAEFTKSINCKETANHFNNRGLVYFKLDLMDEALKDFDDALERDDQDAMFHFNRGNVYLNIS
jgi:tetratricopeptide (TPR) repeat protein